MGWSRCARSWRKLRARNGIVKPIQWFESGSPQFLLRDLSLDEPTNDSLVAGVHRQFALALPCHDLAGGLLDDVLWFVCMSQRMDWSRHRNISFERRGRVALSLVEPTCASTQDNRTPFQPFVGGARLKYLLCLIKQGRHLGVDNVTFETENAILRET